MKFARYVFLIGGIYGLFATVPLYFGEKQMAIDYPPAITHPVYFYSFIGVTAAWQILFLFISRDPLRYRALMIPCALEKAAMLVTFLILYPQGRFPQLWIPFAIIDISIGVLFLVSYFKTKQSTANSTASKSYLKIESEP